MLQPTKIFQTIVLILCCSFYSFAQIKPTPATDRLKNSEQRKLLQERSLVNKIPFRNIGPSIMSGRVVDLEVNPTDPTEFYVAYATRLMAHNQ